MTTGKKLAIAGVVVASATGYMAWLGASASWQYYVTADECLANASTLTGHPIRVSGKIAAGSLKIDEQRRHATFELACAGGKLPVACGGPLPDKLAESMEVVVEGQLASPSLLRGDKVITKCASKYASKTAVASRWRSGGRYQGSMTNFGQACMLIALVATGYAAFACMAGGWKDHRAIVRSGYWAARIGGLALTATVVILARALVSKDFHFHYVTEYSDATLPWHWSLAGFWVGQAGSLLLWAWFVTILATVFSWGKSRSNDSLRVLAFGVLMGYTCFLVAIMVFAADPMEPNLATAMTGDGLSPALQHPAMLVHPPIVFMGYAAWGIPFALALAALMTGRLDDAWVRQARPWALFAWAVLGGGILWGADWAYEELGWGGYWSWDPVENGSLIPWLTGTALVHGLMTWRNPGVFKKTTMALAIATFGLCNFATFLIRSGVLSSLHAFSQSPIGWMFLAWIFVFPAGAIVLLVVRRRALAPDRPIGSIWSREALVLMGTVALILLATVALLGTLAAPISGLFSKSQIVVGPAFYNYVLMPIALVLLVAMGAMPMLRWNAPPTAAQTRSLAIAASVGAAAAMATFAAGARHPVAMAIAMLSGMLVTATVMDMISDCRILQLAAWWQRPLLAMTRNRRKYAAFLIHLGFGSLAIGIVGSSLGSRKFEVAMRPGETIQWAGRSVHYVDSIQTSMPDKLVVEAQLKIAEGKTSYTLLPAQLLHRTQDQWTTQVAIHSTWEGDFYVILQGGRDHGRITLTLIENPMMRWLWLSGWAGGLGAILAAWPVRARRRGAEGETSLGRSPIQKPHFSTTQIAHGKRHDK